MTSEPTPEPTIDERVAAFRMELTLLGVPADRVRKETTIYRGHTRLAPTFAKHYRQVVLDNIRYLREQH